MDKYFACFAGTAQSAWATLKAIDVVARHWAGVVGQALVSERAIRLYQNTFDTVVFLAKAAVLLGQIARVLVAWVVAAIAVYVESCEGQAAPQLRAQVADGIDRGSGRCNWAIAIDCFDSFVHQADDGRGSGRILAA